ncbi:hypothetical protein ACIHCM_28555 [Streptomyces sp. NPDC052023]|uniref:hypothetical protein n=1 Tax=Streptomyces sp. NPDC052023 TaxID=3365681 RepID=UPI0037CED17E
MSSARRPLLTATAAGTLLGALWFVPSANATGDAPVRERAMPVMTTQARAATTDAGTAAVTDSGAVADTELSGAGGTRLADTGSFDSTPYVLGGAFCLTLGAGFVAYSVRRERLGL